MIRLMMQGDRDAKGIDDAVRALGNICKEREIGLNVGEAGQIVRILGCIRPSANHQTCRMDSRAKR